MSFTEHTGAEAGITRVEEDELLWVRCYLVGPRVMDSPHHGGGVQDLLQEVNHSFVIPAASSRLSIGHTCRKSTRTMLPRPPALVPPNSRVWSSFCPTRWDMVCLANMCPASGKREGLSPDHSPAPELLHSQSWDLMFCVSHVGVTRAPGYKVFAGVSTGVR